MTSVQLKLANKIKWSTLLDDYREQIRRINAERRAAGTGGLTEDGKDFVFYEILAHYKKTLGG